MTETVSEIQNETISQTLTGLVSSLTTCKPFLFFGAFGTIISLIIIMWSFTKGVTLGIQTFVVITMFTTLLILLVRYFCAKSTHYGWVAGGAFLGTGVFVAALLFIMHKVGQNSGVNDYASIN
jgi:hypothetical protein